MKKITTFILCAVLCAAMSVPAFAADLDKDTPGGSTQITTGSEPTYTVTIPASLNIDYNSTATKTLPITATDVFLEAGKKVSVGAKGSGASDAFIMTNGGNALTYELSRSDTLWSAVSQNSEVVAFTANGTQNLYVKVPNWSGTVAGSYTGTIIFTVSYKISA